MGHGGQVPRVGATARVPHRAEMTKIDPHVDGCPSEVLARRNVELADVLVAAEQTRFRQGAGDLLALQLREQAALEARFAELSSVSDYFLALADYRVATAEELR